MKHIEANDHSCARNMYIYIFFFNVTPPKITKEALFVLREHHSNPWHAANMFLWIGESKPLCLSSSFIQASISVSHTLPTKIVRTGVFLKTSLSHTPKKKKLKPKVASIISNHRSSTTMDVWNLTQWWKEGGWRGRKHPISCSGNQTKKTRCRSHPTRPE